MEKMKFIICMMLGFIFGFASNLMAADCSQEILSTLKELNIKHHQCYTTKGPNIRYHFTEYGMANSGWTNATLLTIALPTIDDIRLADPRDLQGKEQKLGQIQALHSICYNLNGELARVITGEITDEALVYNLANQRLNSLSFRSAPVTILDCYIDLPYEPNSDYDFEHNQKITPGAAPKNDESGKLQKFQGV